MPLRKLVTLFLLCLFAHMSWGQEKPIETVTLDLSTCWDLPIEDGSDAIKHYGCIINARCEAYDNTTEACSCLFTEWNDTFYHAAELSEHVIDFSHDADINSSVYILANWVRTNPCQEVGLVYPIDIWRSDIELNTTASRYKEETFVIDVEKSSTAIWEIDDIVAQGEFDCSRVNDVSQTCLWYRVFEGVTTEGHYVVQDFYLGEDERLDSSKPLSTRYALTTNDAVKEPTIDVRERGLATSLVSPLQNYFPSGYPMSSVQCSLDKQFCTYVIDKEIHLEPDYYNDTSYNSVYTAQRYTLIDGKRHGIVFTQNEDLSLSYGVMNNGKRIGLWRVCDPTGLCLERHYDNK